MLSGQIPILVLKEGTKRTRGKDAISNNIRAAKEISEAVRSTLGPKGMDKMLVNTMGDVVITNDGVTILNEIDVEHPAAKMIIEVARAQDEECRDGTTTAVVLAGEFLKRSEELLDQNVHPTLITGGFRMAMEHAVNMLNDLAEPVKAEDTEKLKDIAVTAMTGKSAESIKEHLGKISVDAVRRVSSAHEGVLKVDLDDIQIIKKHGGNILDTSLIEGMIIDKERVNTGMPRSVASARIALLNSALEIKKTEISAEIKITSPQQLQQFLDEEEDMLKKMVETIKESGANVVMCQKGIEDLPQYYLSKAGIYAVQRVSESDMKKLAKATGGRMINNINDLTGGDLGRAGLVEERKIADSDMTFITGCDNARAVTILIRGGTEHVLDELQRNLDDALGVVGVALEDGKMVTGGGAAPMELSRHLRDYAQTVGGLEQLAIEAFARSIEIIPQTLAQNAGLDPIDIMIDLRKAHSKNHKHIGLNVHDGIVTDMRELNVVEPMRVLKQAIQGATETAIMILRIDDVIAAKGAGGGGRGMPGGPGGAGMDDFD